jgi:hypothetical protein
MGHVFSSEEEFQIVVRLMDMDGNKSIDKEVGLDDSRRVMVCSLGRVRQEFARWYNKADNLARLKLSACA